MSDQNDRSEQSPEPAAVTTAETDVPIEAPPSEQEPVVANDAGSEAETEEPPSAEPDPQPELDNTGEEELPPVEPGTNDSHVVEPNQQTPLDDEDGEEMPLAVSDESALALSERFNAQTEIEDDLRRAEDEMSYLREQVRHDPTVLAAIQEQQNKLEYIANTSFDLSEKIAELSKTVAVLSVHLQKVSEETEQTAAWSASTKLISPLSKTFLVLAIVVLVALLGGVGYLAVNQVQLQQRQDKVSHLVTQAVEAQNKRQAEFDKQFAAMVGTEIKQERESISKESIQSKLNRVRGGAVEQRLLRKSNGDWLLPKGKTEEQITDHDLIEYLNQMFEKSGRSLTTHPSIPPHKVVSVLKPNGKGGTDLVVTKEVVQ